jgi:hypothetical protein
MAAIVHHILDHASGFRICGIDYHAAELLPAHPLPEKCQNSHATALNRLEPVPSPANSEIASDCIGIRATVCSLSKGKKHCNGRRHRNVQKGHLNAIAEQ